MGTQRQGQANTSDSEANSSDSGTIKQHYKRLRKLTMKDQQGTFLFKLKKKIFQLLIVMQIYLGTTEEIGRKGKGIGKGKGKGKTKQGYVEQELHSFPSASNMPMHEPIPGTSSGIVNANFNEEGLRFAPQGQEPEVD